MTQADRLVRRAGKRSLVSFGLTFSGMFMGLLMQAMVARELGAAGYGIFGVILSALMVLASLLPMGWFECTPKFVAEYREGAQDPLLWGVVTRSQQFCLLTTLLASIGLFLIEWLWAPDSGVAEILLGIAVLLPTYTLIRIQQQILLTMQRVADGLIFVHLVSPATVVFGMLLWRHPGIEGVVALCLLGNVVAFLLQGLRLLRALPARHLREYRSRHWHSVASSLMGGVTGQRLINQGDVMILAPFAGVAEVGIYALARRFADVVVFANQALSSALAPMLGAAIVGRRYVQARRLLWLCCLWSSLWALPFVLSGMLLPSAILRMLGGSFEGGALVLQITLLGALANAASGPVGQALLIGGQEKFWRRSAAISSLLGLVGYLIAAPLCGQVGMAIVRTAYIGGLSLWRFQFLRNSLEQSEASA